jgi:hypothetical protein
MNHSRLDKRLRSALEEHSARRDEEVVICIVSAYDNRVLPDLERFLHEAGIEIRHKLKLAKAFSIKASLRQVELLAEQNFVKQIRAVQPQSISPYGTV